MDKDARIYVAGHNGLVGSAIARQLRRQGYNNLLERSHAELDLQNQNATDLFFHTERPEYVFLAAARVGGIHANSAYPASFIYENIMVQSNVIQSAHKYEVKKLLYLGSSCIYPRLVPQPIKEEYLMTGPLEPTNEAYAVAKLAGIYMCQAYRRQYGNNFIAVMPTNLYGPGDNYDLENSHVLPALLRKFFEAKRKGGSEVIVWGSGTPRREFLYVDDMAEACIFLMNQYSDEGIINIGTGEDIRIAELAGLIADIVGYKGKIVYDAAQPDGMPVKRLDVSKINQLGWHAKTSLLDGLRQTHDWFKEQFDTSWRGRGH